MSDSVYEDAVIDQSKKPTVFEILKRIYNFIAKVFLYSVILIMVFLGVLFSTYALDYVKNISKGNYKPLYGAYVIISPSMVPTIKVQDAVVIKNVPAEKLRKGDIITFVSTDSRYAGLTVTHRIIDVVKADDGKLLFRTKGDNNNTPDDALVNEDNVDGRVFLKIPKIGYLQYFLSQSYGWIICIVVPCLAIIAFEIVKIFKTARRSVVRKINRKEEHFKTKKQRKASKVEVIADVEKEDSKEPETEAEIEIITEIDDDGHSTFSDIQDEEEQNVDYINFDSNDGDDNQNTNFFRKGKKKHEKK